MRFVMLVPKSLDPVERARKMPVPDARPSAEIAKLFPQKLLAKDQPGQMTADIDRCRRRRRRLPRSAPHVPLPGTADPPQRPRVPCAISGATATSDETAARPARSVSALARRGATSARKSARCGRAWRGRSSRSGRSRASARRRRCAGTSRGSETCRARPAVRTGPAPEARQAGGRRRWRRSDAASARGCREAATRSTRGSICMA